MKIERITLVNFKRFTKLTIEGIPETAKLVLLVGPNGSGKSSVFEALHHWYRSQGYRFGHSAEEKTFFVKNANEDSSDRWASNCVRVHFYNKNQLTQEEIQGALYFRTAHRNDPDFTIQQLTKLGDPKTSDRFLNLIGTDSLVSQNYQRLVSLTLASLYDERNNSKTAIQLREELIGKVKNSLSLIFEDLQLEGIGDPLGSGSFYFTKGDAHNFHYKNLSAGEKSAFDLILDLVIKKQYYPEAIFCIDEPEIHMHTALQSRLLGEMFNQIPENGQLWLTTHSIGMLKKAQDIEANNPGTVVFLDFSNIDFDVENTLTPAIIDTTIWRRFMDLAFDEFSSLIAPKTIVFCEGNPQGKKNAKFDEQVYSKIFKTKIPPVCFVSVESCNVILSPDNISFAIIKQVLSNSQIIKLVDRDDRSDEEIEELKEKGIKVLSRRNLEAFLLDDEVIRKLCITQGKEDKYASILEAKKNALQNSVQRGNASDDLKSAAGDIYNTIKRELCLSHCGSTTHAFLRDCMASLITPDMSVYKELENCIFTDCIIEVAQ